MLLRCISAGQGVGEDRAQARYAGRLGCACACKDSTPGWDYILNETEHVGIRGCLAVMPLLPGLSV